jgi:O-methyltransferase
MIRITSKILKTGQQLILMLRLPFLFTPFLGIFQKLICLSRFSTWKNQRHPYFILQHYTNRFRLYSQLIKVENLRSVCYLEFGVYQGTSMRWWLNEIIDSDSLFFGFDTFEGLPSDWGTKQKGSYSNNGTVPTITDARCTLIKGLFQETLFEFVRTHELKKRIIIHFDADLYSSTLFCLFTIAPLLKKGDLLIFDEFDSTTHEFRALVDFQHAFPMTLSLIGESNNFNKVVLKVK